MVRSPIKPRRSLVVCRLAVGLLLAACGAPLRAQGIDFARDVLPILSDRCFACHGPDEEARKGDLRLDRRETALAAIRPGDADDSALIARITAQDDGQMPPPESGLALSESEIATLRAWVDGGATWSRHWAFETPTRPALPNVDDASWIRNPIDRFVLARLEQAGGRPNRAADPAALLRRVSLDLTGLPPTPSEVRAFVADPSDAAFDAAVDRLLASPHYGERMAWPLLEATRYADTDGYQADPTRTAWPWRDWLVRALNDNLPFDEFTIITLAGDLVPDATLDERAATGLLRNNAHNGEGGRIPEETRVENVFDRTETMATLWMGLTLECARCHDHKYDPISQREYYGLYAFFDQTSETGRGRRGGVLEPVMRYPLDAGVREDRERVGAQLQKLERRLYGPNRELDEAQAVWEQETAPRIAAARAALKPATLGPWRRTSRLAPPEGDATAMFSHVYPAESVALAHPRERSGSAANGSEPDHFAADPKLPLPIDGQPLRLPQGQYTVYFARDIVAASPRRMAISLGSDDAIRIWCNGREILGNDTRRGVAADQEHVELQLDAGPNRLVVKIVNTGGAGGIYFRRVDESASSLPTAVVRALLVEPSKRSIEQRRTLLRHFRRTTDERFDRVEQRRARLRAQLGKLDEQAPRISVMDELPADRRRTTRILERGNYAAPGEPVTAATPAFLPPVPAGPADRLTLARWLVDDDHPLTARVAVNRAWQTITGRGLVRTSEDFGRQGERPTHPQLLDWLARWFVDSGWNTKALHRLIVTSATYRQSASAPAASFRDDPGNAQLARSSRLRLPAWMLRDQAIALSGRLVDRLGGEPVRPYQPAGVWAEATFGTIRYEQDDGDALYRRSLYTFWRRIVGPTVFFDTPPRQTCVVRRSTTNTPLHALTTLNETGFVEAARGLAARAHAAGTDTRSRLRWMFFAATARDPDASELAELERRHDEARRTFIADPARADALLGVGDAPVGGGVDRPMLAASTVLASIVLNLDEVLTRP